MKKLVSIVLAAVLTIAVAGVGMSALAASSADVYVTIVDNTGKLQLTQQYITVSDTDSDGVITVKDALYEAHQLYYPGGAQAGYACAYTLTWGWSLAKLWGQTNSGSFGYYINNLSAYSLTDTLKSGDYLNAFCYTDAQNYSDVYTYFDSCCKDITQYETTTLTLSYYTYDYTTWELIAKPLANAEITINGEKTGIKTDAQGKASVTFDNSGSFTVSAVSSNMLIVSPVCTVNVAAASIYVRLLHMFQMIINIIKSFFTV